MSILILIPVFLALLAVAFVFYLFQKIRKSEQAEGKVLEISKLIKDGTKTLVLREVKTMIVVFIITAIALGFVQKTIYAPLMFLFGALISVIAGYLGMRVSTAINPKIVQKAQHSLKGSFHMAFWSGEIIGFLIVGLGILGIIIAWGIFTGFQNADLLINYAFGASLTALFLRVGGGIFTKSADMGADLVGQEELNITKDDERNPAIIADHIGDIAGIGSDLFESYVSSIAAAMVIGAVVFSGVQGTLLPLLIASAGIVSSLVGSIFIKLSKYPNEEDLEKAKIKIKKIIRKGIILSNVLMVIGSFFVIQFYAKDFKLFLAVLCSIVCGLILAKSSEYYTSHKRKPVLDIVKATQGGSPTIVLEGWVVGMRSTVIPITAVSLTLIAAYYLGGLYGIALAGVGLLGVLSMNLATDCYGPIVDNASGIAKISELPKETQERIEILGSVGANQSIMGKSFGALSAVLVSICWLIIFIQQGGIDQANIFDIKTVAGMFIGIMLPFLFSSLIMRAVGSGVLEILNEAKRQFKDKKELAEGTEKPDYNACIDLASKRALREMIFPTVLVIILLVVIGAIFGKAAIGGILLGMIGSGFILSLFMINAGGAWNNAKKHIEAGNVGGEGSDAHKVAIVGDTIGDPFKDITGPSLNILIKLIGVIAILSLPLFI
jgi:K(+)-stimulated pyrophosphate-energized sodium pump